MASFRPQVVPCRLLVHNTECHIWLVTGWSSNFYLTTLNSFCPLLWLVHLIVKQKNHSADFCSFPSTPSGPLFSFANSHTVFDDRQNFLAQVAFCLDINLTLAAKKYQACHHCRNWICNVSMQEMSRNASHIPFSCLFGDTHVSPSPNSTPDFVFCLWLPLINSCEHKSKRNAIKHWANSFSGGVLWGTTTWFLHW